MRRLMTTILGGLALTACSNELAGNLQATHQGQTWSVTPDQCNAGQRQGFFGVDVRAGDGDDARVRAVYDPTASYTVRLDLPGSDKHVNITEGQGCTTFDVVVERQNSTVNNVANVRGHLRLACDLPDLKVQADVTFANCH